VIEMLINKHSKPCIPFIGILVFWILFVFSAACGGGGEIETLETETASNNPTYGVVTLSWRPPTENTDGSELTDLTGFKVYYGESENELTQTISIDSATTLAKVIENLTIEKTYYFAVTAVNSLGIESEMSNITSKFIDG